MKQKSIHIIYSGLGGHFDYVFNLISAMNAAAETSILFFGVEPVPADYLKKCNETGIVTDAILKRGYGVKAAWQILQVLKKQNPGLIYVHSNAAVVPVWLHKIFRGAKLVLIEHHNNQLKTAKDHKRSRFAQKRFDRVVFLTQAHCDEARTGLKERFSKKKSVVIQTGIPAVYFNAPVRQQSKQLVIGMQSRLVPIKDHDTLIRAFRLILAEFPGAELRIAGDGVEKQRLVNLVKELDLAGRVCFEGMLSKKELITWLGQLTIYVHATFGETSSIALMEALAQGLPVVASDVSGIHDFLNEETAVLVPPKNVAKLSSAISELWGNEKKRRALSENAYNFAVTNCSLQKMADSYLQLENQILSTHD